MQQNKTANRRHDVGNAQGKHVGEPFNMFGEKEEGHQLACRAKEEKP